MSGNSLIARGLAVACILLMSLPALSQMPFGTDILRDTFRYGDNTKKSVSLRDLHQGCRSRDCIPSIDRPKYVAAADADHVADDDLVLTLSLKGYHRAWPTRILDQHEIVNDIIADIPVAITWCPLCGSAIGVVREFDGQVTEFGVSGLLYNSDLVFYDRKTETLWDQIEAKGIVGPLTGTELELIPISVSRWGKWKDAHPDTLVLSEDTGFALDYSRVAYGDYRSSNRLMFPVSRNNDVIPPKTVVYGFQVGDQAIAFTESLLQESQNVAYENTGGHFDITLAKDGGVSMTSRDANEVFHPVRLFWFAWYTFHPDTDLVR